MVLVLVGSSIGLSRKMIAENCFWESEVGISVAI